MTDTITFSRQQLYNLVWAESILSLSKRFNISDVGLRKICLRMEIPVPSAGHWAKLQHGKKIKQQPLPANFKGEETIRLEERNKESDNEKTKELSVRNEKMKEIQETVSLDRNTTGKLQKPHQLIIASKNAFAKKQTGHYSYIGTLTSVFEALDIRVAKENVERALMIFNNFIKTMERRGHRIVISNSKTIAVIAGHEYQVSLKEKMRKETRKNERWGHSETVYHPVGMLVFHAGQWGRTEYKDGKLTLEEQLPRIIADLESAATERTRWRMESERAEKERLEKVRNAKEREERKQQELIDFKNLLTEAERWHKAEILRNYIGELQRRVDVNQVNPEMLSRISWAKQKADWYDPFTETVDELLECVDRNSLQFILP